MDRPRARHVLNTEAYACLIAVVDAGILVRLGPTRSEILELTWTVQSQGQQRPCLRRRGAYSL